MQNGSMLAAFWGFLLQPGSMASWLGRFAALLVFTALSVGPVWAQSTGAAAPAPQSAPVYTLRVVGGLAGVAQFTRFEEPFWNHELARLSGGRYSATIVPFDRAGVPGADMLRLLELGVVPFGTFLLSLSGQVPQYGAADLVGLNPDMASLRSSVAVFRPYLERALREEHGIEALAIYVYPAQMLFCKQPIKHLADLRARRVRVSSAGQADFVAALDATPVHTAFSQIVARFEAGTIDCAITGTMSGNTLGLPRLTTHLYALPLNWGMAVFGANRTAWEALPEDLRSMLRRELPRLESAIWAESERDTAQGLACNSGASGCKDGTPGKMVIVPATAEDRRRTQEIFVKAVLPQWLQRCGPRCAEIWQQTIGPARGLAVTRP